MNNRNDYNIGIPILRLDVCSESQASFTCVVTESTTLHWDVDFLSGDDINRVTFILSDTIGRELSPMNRGTGVNVYKFNLTSNSPLTSTMTTNTPTDLAGATISCSNGAQSSADVATLDFPGISNCNHF